MGTWTSTTSVSSSGRWRLAAPSCISLAMWAGLIAAFHASVGDVPTQGLAGIVFPVLLASLYAAWLSVTHTIVSSVLRLRMRGWSQGMDQIRHGSTAVLLCTRDDWRADIAEWSTRLLEDGDHLFICDDSQQTDSRRAVDAFARLHPTTCTVVRRNTLYGFKAGNLNHCLAQIGSGYTFVAVLDHDTRLHPDALRRARQHFSRDESIAFVQFGLRHDDCPETAFARDLSLSIDLASWLHAVRGSYGIPICIGRAVVFQAQALRECGGFPTVVSEDIGITLTLLRRGRRGCYDAACPASESVPRTYQRFRARQARWSIGTLHAWIGHSTRLPWHQWLTFEAVDVFLQILVLWYPFITFAFAIALLAAGLTIPLPPQLVIVLLPTALVPLLPSIPLLAIAYRAQALRAVMVHGAVYMSMIVSINSELVAFAISRRIEFVNSGNRLVDRRDAPESLRALFSSNGRGTLLVECALFIALAVIVGSRQWFLLPLEAGIGAAILFRVVGWESRACRLAAVVPPLACVLVAWRVYSLL
jgi:hypothetical protein